MSTTRIFRDVTETMGNTPLIQLNKMAAAFAYVISRKDGQSITSRLRARMICETIDL